MSDSSFLMPLSMVPPTEWWLVADVIWAGPDRWMSGAALPMRGTTAAGGDPVPTSQIPPDARTLETYDMLLPGLHDAHVHTGLIDLPAVRRGGIAAVTDLGGVPEEVDALRTRSLDPASDLPVVAAVGPFLTAPGGYPSDRSWAAPGSWREVHSVADAETAVAEQGDLGAGAVKVAVNVSAGPVMPQRVLATVVSAAHARDLRVVAHAEGEGSVLAALDAGVDVLAHTPWTEELGADLVRECAEQTTWISTTNIHGRSPALQVAINNMFRFLEAGGTVRYGTDLGNGKLPLGVNSQETLALQTVGMSVDEVLAAMTEPLVVPKKEQAANPVANPPSRFIAGVPPCVLPNPISPRMRVVGPMLRQAQVFSLAHLQDLEKVQP